MASAAGGGGGSGPSMPGLAQGGGGASAGTGASGASAAAASVTASLAGKRGSNWASLATMSTPVPLTRPIRIECAAGEFRVLAEGSRVDLISEFDGHERRATDFLVVPYSTPVGNAAAYYPETNPLIPLDHTARKSNTPVSKAVVIRLVPGGERSDGGSDQSWVG